MLIAASDQDFARWKAELDAMGAARKANGFDGYALYQDPTDPNAVIVVNRVRDVAGAKAYGASPAGDARGHGLDWLGKDAPCGGVRDGLHFTPDISQDPCKHHG